MNYNELLYLFKSDKEIMTTTFWGWRDACLSNPRPTRKQLADKPKVR